MQVTRAFPFVALGNEVVCNEVVCNVVLVYCRGRGGGGGVSGGGGEEPGCDPGGGGGWGVQLDPGDEVKSPSALWGEEFAASMRNPPYVTPAAAAMER